MISPWRPNNLDSISHRPCAIVAVSERKTRVKAYDFVQGKQGSSDDRPLGRYTKLNLFGPFPPVFTEYLRLNLSDLGPITTQCKLDNLGMQYASHHNGKVPAEAGSENEIVSPQVLVDESKPHKPLSRMHNCPLKCKE